MIDILVVTHGDFCNGILSSVEMIMGDHKGIKPISLSPNAGLSELRETISEEIEECKQENTLIFTDLFGATPYNASVLNTKDFSDMPIKVISGLNLPMLLEAKSLMDTMKLDELYDHIIKIGKESIVGYTYSKTE